MWHSASGKKPQPLIVSLHTWSGDYAQRDPMAELAVARGFNYIHPDLQGPNMRPKACGSDLVVADLDAAIDYALARGNVDRTNIHVIGVSGGGHAAMLAWMRSRHDVRSFSSWVGISDLEKWHAESAARGHRYAEDLERVTTGTAGHFDPVEARRRSPLWLQTPIARRQGSRLLLHAGVHDGYTGSVPISQTIEFYNHVVDELAPGAAEARVPAAIAEALAKRQALPGEAPSRTRQPGETIYERHLHDRVRLNIFEGGHEMLVAHALVHVPSPPAASPAATLHPHKP
jgi:dienelactone hydrolase